MDLLDLFTVTNKNDKNSQQVDKKRKKLFNIKTPYAYNELILSFYISFMIFFPTIKICYKIAFNELTLIILVWSKFIKR